MFQGSFKSVSRKFQECFKEVLRVFQGSVKGVSCFREEEVSRMFHDFLRAFTECSRCFKKNLCCMALIAASRAEGGLVQK